MLQKIKRILRSKFLLSIIMLVASYQISHAQLLGFSNVAPNSQHDYIYDPGLILFKANWAVTGGTVVSSTISGTVYTATVLWGGVGSGSVSFRQGGNVLDDILVTIAVPVPNVPSVPTITQNCGNTVLTRGAPPSGITWYWQSSSTGTSTSNSASSVTRTSGTVYYLRARDNTSAVWSAARSVNYTIKIMPNTPTAPTITNNCGNTAFTRASPPSGEVWYWQSTSTGTSTNHSESTLSLSSGTVYYLRAKNTSSGCWSTTRTINYTVNVVPSTPSAPTVAQNCGNTVLTRGTPPSGITFYWQSSSSGTSTSNSSSTNTRTTGTVYYLRSRNNTSLCWGAAVSVNYAINAVPTTPGAPAIGYLCGATKLTRSTPPSGITYYWQSSASGTSTSSSTVTSTHTSGTVYYLRAKNNTSGCWSTSRTINYTVNVVPGTPSAPAVAQNCGNTVLTRSAPPSGITYYWQSSSSGTSTSNSGTTSTQTSGTLYYLRARNNTSQCWGTAVSVNYSVTIPTTWYADTDGDGYGNANSTTSDCSQPAGYVSISGDYDDTTVNITNIAPQTFYRDIDGDGFGDPNVSVYYSVQPIGYVTNNTDNCPNEYGTNSGCEYASPVFSNKNYVFTRSFQKAMLNTSEISQNRDVIESITYYDGLGRPEQTRANNAGGNKEDILSAVVYDGFGRQSKQYLPTADNTTNSLLFKTTSTLLSEIETYYTTNFADDINGNSPNPYSESTYDESPLNRVLQQAAPGEDWKIGSGHEIKMGYNTNVLDEVRRYDVSLAFANNTYTPTLSLNGSGYLPNTLSKTVTKDENWTSGDNHTIVEFKDKSGRVILKRTYNDNVKHDTFYVYDDYGNLTYVLPPKMDAGDPMTTIMDIDIEMNDLGYQYKYDVRNRLVEKRIPGKDWEYIVYNLLDQPIMTQDAILKLQDKWLITKYDAFGRVVYTGVKNTSSSRTYFQNVIDAEPDQYESKVTSGTGYLGTYYTSNSTPTSLDEIYTINHYDTYVDMGALNITATTYKGETSTANANGLPTVSKVRVLGEIPVQWITTVSYYDDKARLIYGHTDNPYLGTTDIVETDLDFTGKPNEVKTTHTKDSNSPIVTYERFEYDHTGRLLAQTQKVDDEISRRLLHNNYDNLGQLKSKYLDNGTQDGYKDLVGVSVSDDEITKTAATGWGTGGLATNGSFSADGYVEYEIPQTNKWLMVGLSSDNSSASYNTIDYAIYHAGTELKIYESGSNKGLMPSYQVGDILRVERIGTTVYYKKNGITFYTSTVSSTGSLLGDVAISSNLGKIKDLKIVDNSKGLQTVDYSYNIRGWLKEINDVNTLGTDLFAFKLGYNAPEATINGFKKALYNGNISETIWKTASLNHLGNPSEKHTYNYNYDDLNRIITGNFGFGDSYTYTGAYKLYVESYDKNGNIVKLYRNGKHATPGNNAYLPYDNLDYTYNGNQLTEVDDLYNVTEGYNEGSNSGAGVDYTYDANGNMITDASKGINTDITYNHLNLPTLVSINGSGGNGTISYIYDASGAKLKKVVTEGSSVTTTKYAGNYIYKETSGVENLEFFNHAEGYIESDGSGGYDYVYQYKDHLGNIRLSYKDTNGDGVITAASEILEENNYYPFGLKHKGYNGGIVGAQNNHLTYNGKEWDKSLDLNTFDLGARQMDPAIGRFMTIDPMADFVNYQSPYVVADNNPVQNVDFYGLGIWNWIKGVVGKIGNGIKKLFSGNNCDCSSNGESLAQAFRRPDNIFPRRKKNRRRKNRRGDAEKTETTTEGTKRPKVTPINLFSFGVVASNTEGPTAIVDLPTPAIIFNGREIPPGKTVNFKADVKFNNQSDTFKNNPYDEKTISKLIKTLNIYPHLKVVILGNSVSKDPNATLSSPAGFNGAVSTMGKLQLGRAEAVRQFLIGIGIDPSRIEIGNGVINRAGDEGYLSSSFNITNPNN